jgi:hypothetical protein
MIIIIIYWDAVKRRLVPPGREKSRKSGLIQVLKPAGGG